MGVSCERSCEIAELDQCLIMDEELCFEIKTVSIPMGDVKERKEGAEGDLDMEEYDSNGDEKVQFDPRYNIYFCRPGKYLNEE